MERSRNTEPNHCSSYRLPTTESDSDENDPTQLQLDEYWLHQDRTDRSVLTREERLEMKQEELSKKKQPGRDQLVSEQQQDPTLEEVLIRLRTSDPQFVQEDGHIFETNINQNLKQNAGN